MKTPLNPILISFVAGLFYGVPVLEILFTLLFAFLIFAVAASIPLLGYFPRYWLRLTASQLDFEKQKGRSLLDFQ